MRPNDRRSFAYRVYCSLVCSMKLHRSKALAFEVARAEFGWNSTIYGRRVYRKYIRPQLASGTRIEELF